MAFGDELARRRWRPASLAPLAVAVAAALLACYWVFLVPIFQAPDEPPHLDYALSIYSAGHLLNVRQQPLAPAAFDLVVNPYAAYLERETGFSTVHDSHGPMPLTYGSCAYYQQLDRNAPPNATVPFAPSLITQYPFGYYALLAVWLHLIGALTSGVVALFFWGRLLSVVLFFCSLLLSYGIARELGIRRWAALGLMALIGFFPMTTFVSSYIQPDNLTFTLVALSTYLALLLRRRVGTVPLFAGLGLSLGTLLVTKWHIYLCLAPWLVATVVLAQRFSWKRSHAMRAAVLALPSLLLGAVQLWVVWGGGLRSYSLTGSGRPIFGPLLQALHGGPLSALAYIGPELGAAFTSFFVSGQVTSSFWGRFGYDDTPLHFGLLDSLVQGARLVLVLGVLVLFIDGRRRIVARLIAIGRRRGWKTALALGLSDPLLNAYVTFTLFMIVLYIASANFFAEQGRNWLPFLLPLFLVPLRYAGRTLPLARARRIVARSLAIGLAAYCIGGSFFAVQAIRDRYYVPAAAVRPVIAFTCTPLPGAVALAQP